MPIVHAIVLGLVQGLSEFFPISSSGHLLLVPWLFDWHDLDDARVEKSFDVALHIGTLASVIVYMRVELTAYFKEGTRLLVKRERPVTPEGRIAWLLVLASVPAAVVGLAFENWIDDELGTPTIIAISLIGFGLILLWADRTVGNRKIERLEVRDSLLIGAAQALALNPGTSRSGITMTAARRLGFDRDAAVRISFLMSIPVIVGAGVLKVGKLIADGMPSDLVIPMIVGVFVSGLSGYVAIWATMRFVRSHSLTPFVAYRIALGVIVLVIVATGWR
jgi:undecaprenyl-diphosphatase